MTFIYTQFKRIEEELKHYCLQESRYRNESYPEINDIGKSNYWKLYKLICDSNQIYRVMFKRNLTNFLRNRFISSLDFIR